MNERRHARTVRQVDIAAAADCSQNTVTLALAGSNRISAARRKQILGIAKKMGYRPNLTARNLRTGRSGLVGILTGALDEARTMFIGEMLSRFCYDTDYKPILGMDPKGTKPWYEAPWIETLLQLQVEALVSFAWHDFPQLPDWYQQVPIIMSGNQTDESLPCDAISIDRAEGGRKAAEHLISRGHRRIAMIEPWAGYEITRGYERSMSEAGLETQLFTRREDESLAGHLRRFVDSLKDGAKPPTAAFMLSSPLAEDLCRLALSEGIRVPDDLAVVGYGGIPGADRMVIPLTTVERPIVELSSRTVEITCNRLENLSGPPVHVELPHRLEVRKST